MNGVLGWLDAALHKHFIDILCFFDLLGIGIDQLRHHRLYKLDLGHLTARFLQNLFVLFCRCIIGKRPDFLLLLQLQRKLRRVFALYTEKNIIGCLLILHNAD
ncbi:hypothetical protein D3C80_1393710 [compost metagenome]